MTSIIKQEDEIIEQIEKLMLQLEEMRRTNVSSTYNSILINKQGHVLESDLIQSIQNLVTTLPKINWTVKVDSNCILVERKKKVFALDVDPQAHVWLWEKDDVEDKNWNAFSDYPEGSVFEVLE